MPDLNGDDDGNENGEAEKTKQPLPIFPKEAKEEVPMSVVDFLNAVEEPLKDKFLPLELGQTIYTSLLGTAQNMAPAENVKVPRICICFQYILPITCIILRYLCSWRWRTSV